jgi:hypothetical protein
MAAPGLRETGTGRPWNRILLVAALALWAWVTVPWLVGSERLILRDVLYSHTQYKFFGAEQLAEGRIPAINPTWSLGQPFRGNPNALPFYPGNLLYLILPFQVAFHAHYALHWLLAFAGMRRLARELGQSETAALFAAITWAGSGYLLTLLAFYNLLAVVSWAPFALHGIARGGRRSTIFAGLAAAMMLLGGEPMTAALLVPAMIAVAVTRHGARRGALVLAAAGAIAVAVALPQIVATLRVLPFTFRSAHGLEPAETAWQSLHPARWLELVLPLPWGWPSDYSRFGYWSKVVTPDIPFVYSIHVGVVGFALALGAARRRRVWAALAAAALVLAWAGGLAPELLAGATGGVFRYPQKLAVLFTLAAALLAGWGLDARLGHRGTARALAFGAGGVFVTALVLRLFHDRFVALLRDHLAEGRKEPLAATHAASWEVALVAAGLLLAAAAWAIARGRGAAVAAVQLVGLLQLAPILTTDAAAPYRQPPPLYSALGDPKTLVPIPHNEPDWEPRIPFPIGAYNPAAQARVSWFQLEPAFGVPLGVSYPLSPDIDGLNTPLHVFLWRNLQLGQWPGRVRWLARLGVGWVVRFDLGEVEGLERVARYEQFGVPVALSKVPDPAPPVRWPERLALAPTPIHAFVAVGDGRVAPADAVVARPVRHAAGGRVDLIERGPDRWVVDVDSAGGLMVVQTAWHPIWTARLEDGTPLATEAADLVLTGVEVPAGRHRVTLEVSAAPEQAAGAAALAVAAAALLVALRHRRGAGVA